ncbi:MULTISPECIES: class I SAM-dependent methyltransferase [unclassified Bacillus (in: firmicutes)]|uniref:class I SAM-dependent methyltransferase n=1 Tax=unclassified Bacillus (in: firmicutes) TaxID=185979 RepID=UPI00032F88B3|nr:SAM-dependent methyltransferase [Bacillus cereus BAG2O-3]EOQ11282.1 SAM-dependent methyltransferase [Bacillus cereus B5-2]EOQ30130.1 SAM-dependent methyltransferase [Bacillus cereus BAG3O-1]PEW27496.1 class I SAM-dependent methyltransferase [Bacillus cereus]PFW81949.1 class I SAM-dependent methyltransferase [Bacillus sp. AFS075960]RFB43477.1 class I SAM-dependent methyltransferase [Bacillus sp. dmp10]
MSKEELVKQQFGNNAEKYVKSKIHAKGPDLQYVVQQVESRHNKRLLDIATGGGHVANVLAPLFQEVVALDLTEKMLENAKNFIISNGHDNVSFVDGNAESLPFSDSSFDTITCRIAAHHFTNPAQFIYEVNRTLEDNGLFILIDNVSPENNEYDTFYNFIEKKRDPSHERALKKTEWITLLEKNGLQMQSCLTFDKKFEFDWWCNMMNVPLQKRMKLTECMMKTSVEMQEFFNIQYENNKIISFYTEMALFVCKKSATLKR